MCEINYDGDDDDGIHIKQRQLFNPLLGQFGQ